MIYTDLTRLAMRVAYKAHEGQVDRDGVPYIFHPIHIAEHMHDKITTCVALLHDVVEDTKYTIEDLRNMMFPEEVTEAVALLTHKKNIDRNEYIAYLRRLADNRTAREVKIEDLRHNSDVTRRACITERDKEKCEFYSKCLTALLSGVFND